MGGRHLADKTLDLPGQAVDTMAVLDGHAGRSFVQSVMPEGDLVEIIITAALPP